MEKKRSSFMDGLIQARAAEAGRIISRCSELGAVSSEQRTKNDTSGHGKQH